MPSPSGPAGRSCNVYKDHGISGGKGRDKRPAPGRLGSLRAQCDMANLRHCSAHGLRKAAARRLAEAGCTEHEIAAITGHASLREVARYTRAADQRRLADAAMKKEKTRNPVSNPSLGLTKRRKSLEQSRGESEKRSPGRDSHIAAGTVIGPNTAEPITEYPCHPELAVISSQSLKSTIIVVSYHAFSPYPRARRRPLGTNACGKKINKRRVCIHTDDL